MLFKNLILIFAAICLIQNTYADIEYTDSENLHEELAQKPNFNLDKTICKSKKEDLWNLFETKIDANNDSVITTNEIEDYLRLRIKDIHNEEIVDQLKRIDPNNTKMVKFEMYIKEIFDNLEDPMILERNNLNSDLKEMKQLFEIERQMWTYLAKNLNDSLSYEKFYQLIYPQEFPELKDIHETFTFNVYDWDKNGFLSVQEFLDYSKDVDDLIVKIEKNKFTGKIDLNSDNKIDLEEFKEWLKQDIANFDQIINEEKNYLLKCCDNNKNGNLNRQEVESNCESFLHSLITNYSKDLKTDDESNNSLKDEL